MSQEVTVAFKRTLPTDIELHMDAFAYVFVIDAQRDVRKAARLYGITPMHALRIVETQPQWTQALRKVMQGNILTRVGDAKMTALMNVADAMVTHPQDELMAIPHPWTRQAIADGLSLQAKDCIKSMKWGFETVFDQELQCDVDVPVLKDIQFNDLRWEATIRVLEAEGVKKVKLMAVDEDGEEAASGFGGVIINFVDAPVG